MASFSESPLLNENGRSESPSHQDEEKDDHPVQSKPTSQYEKVSDTSKDLSRREKKRAKRQQQKEEWKARKRQKRTQIQDVGGSTSSKEPNMSMENLNETSYYFESGLRKVYPYYFKFSTYAKGRWYKRKLIDVLTDEMGAYEPEYFKESMKSNRLKVNGKSVTGDYLLKNQDFMEHLVHRHETPVTDEKIEVIADTEDLFVINKPSSIPVHPCGKYRHNSIVYILAKEYNARNLRGVHRLDRLTSGILIFGKTQKKADELAGLISGRQVEKEYLCRVEGEFPREGATCDEPLEIFCGRIGLHRVSRTGKEAKTVFNRVSYNGSSSVVRCKPLTGRTHQIRVHLQYLGYPIVNDHLYNTTVWGPYKGKGGEFGKSDEQLLTDVRSHHDPKKYIDTTVEKDADPRNIIHPEHSTFEADKLTVDEHCVECKSHYLDPKPEETSIYLHAYRYKGPDFEFKTEIPDWARENWKE